MYGTFFIRSLFSVYFSPSALIVSRLGPFQLTLFLFVVPFRLALSLFAVSTASFSFSSIPVIEFRFVEL